MDAHGRVENRCRWALKWNPLQRAWYWSWAARPFQIGLERRDFFSSDMFIYFRVAAYVYVLLIFVGRQKKRASRPAGQIFNDFQCFSNAFTDQQPRPALLNLPFFQIGTPSICLLLHVFHALFAFSMIFNAFPMLLQISKPSHLLAFACFCLLFQWFSMLFQCFYRSASLPICLLLHAFSMIFNAFPMLLQISSSARHY